MKQIKVIYTNKKTWEKFELVPELIKDGDKACLRPVNGGEDKFYAPSTLKRNFYRDEVEVEVTIEPEVKQDTMFRAMMLRNAVKDANKNNGVEVRETSSYIGIRCNGKSVAEIAWTKKKLSLTVNTEEFFGNAGEQAKKIASLPTKAAPAKYGWRMNFEINVTDITKSEILDLINVAISARL